VEKTKHSFTLLRGGAINVGGPSAALTSLPLQRRSPPQQIELPVVSAARNLLIVHSYLLLNDFEAFRRIVIAHTVRRVLDIRVSPSFAERGFSKQRVQTLLQQVGGEYRWSRELCNPFVGESWNRAVTLERYRAHLGEHRPLLRALLEETDDNTLLLGDHRAYPSSECSVVIDALVSAAGRFKLSIDPDA